MKNGEKNFRGCYIFQTKPIIISSSKRIPQNKGGSAILPFESRRFFHLGVSKNRGTPKSSILIGFSIINHPFWGTPTFGKTHFHGQKNSKIQCVQEASTSRQDEERRCWRFGRRTQGGPWMGNFLEVKIFLGWNFANFVLKLVVVGNLLMVYFWRKNSL